MRILNVSAQKPDSTGSGVYLAQTARCELAAGHEVAVVCGLGAADEPSLPAGVRLFPVRFDTPELPFPVVGMSDQMPYPSTRYRDLTPPMLESFKLAFDARIRQALDEFQPDAVVCHHLYLTTALAQDIASKREAEAAEGTRADASAGSGSRTPARHLPVFAICHSTDLRQMRSHGLERGFIVGHIRALDGIFALHEAQREEIIQLYGCDPGLVRVLGTGFDAALFKREGPVAGAADEAGAEDTGNLPGAAGAAGARGAAAKAKTAAAALPARTASATEATAALAAGGAPTTGAAPSTAAAPAAAASPAASTPPSPGACGPLNILYVGKIWSKKGVGCLLEAFDLMDAGEEGAILRLAGGHNDEAEYQGFVERAERCRFPVEFLGRLSPEELAPRYRQAQVFVLPSFFEGLPLVVVEALACGCRVVVSDLPGIRPWLDASVPDAPVVYVQPPRMRGVDEPLPEDLPAFSERLARALENAAKLPPCEADMSSLSWEGLTQRLVDLILPHAQTDA